MNKNKNEQTLHKRKHVVLAFKNSVCEPEHEPNIAKHQTAKKKKKKNKNKNKNKTLCERALRRLGCAIKKV